MELGDSRGMRTNPLDVDEPDSTFTREGYYRFRSMQHRSRLPLGNGSERQDRGGDETDYQGDEEDSGEPIWPALRGRFEDSFRTKLSFRIENRELNACREGLVDEWSPSNSAETSRKLNVRHLNALSICRKKCRQYRDWETKDRKSTRLNSSH